MPVTTRRSPGASACPRRAAALAATVAAAGLMACSPATKLTVDHGEANEVPEDRLIVADDTVGGGPWTVGTPGGALVYPDIGDPKSFNWIVNNDQSTSEVGRISYADLISINRYTQRCEPELAKAYEVSPDRTSITVHLRRHLKWSDGAPFGMRDVIYTWRAIWNPHVSTPVRDGLALRPDGDTEDRYFRIQVIDDDTLRLVAPCPFAILDRVFSELWIVPEHQLPPIPEPPSVEKAGFVASVATLRALSASSPDLKMYWEVWFRPELERLGRIVPDGQDGDAANLRSLEDFKAALVPWDAKMSDWASEFSSSWSTDLAADPASAEAHLATMGAFRIAQYVAGQYTAFTPNPHYWKFDTAGRRLPYLNKVYLWVVQNQDTMMVKFSSGEGDVLCPVQSIDVGPLRRGQAKGGYTLYEVGPQLQDNHLYFNLHRAWRTTLKVRNTSGQDEDRVYFRYPDKPEIADHYYEDFNVEVKEPELLARLRADQGWKPIVDPAKAAVFQSPWFRRAVSSLVDRDAIAQNLMAGLAVPLYTSIGPGYKDWFDPDVPKYPYDPAAAAGYLDKAGMTQRGSDGFRLGPGGAPFSFTIITNATNEQRVQIGTMLVGELRKVGVNATIQPLDFNVMLTKTQSTFDFDCLILGLGGGDVDQAANGNVYRSSGFTHPWAPKQPVPMTDAEAQVDTLFNTVMTGATLDDRTAAMHRIETIWAEQQFLIHEYARTLFVGARNDVQNMHPALMEMNALWNVAWLYRSPTPGPPAGVAPGTGR